jgi:heat shock protein HslJ
MNTRLCSLIVGATVVATLAACHATPAPKSPAGLQGRAFLIHSSTGADVLAETTVHLRFTNTDLSVGANCNHMGGSYTIEHERVVVGDMAQTMMGCDPHRHAQDDWLQAFFASKPKLVLQGATLTLSNDTSSLVFLDREVADPDQPLQGTVWEINTYTDAETAMGLMGIEPPRLTFAADGTWQARSVCLDASGRYTVEGDRIELIDTRASQGACTDNDKAAADFVRSVLVDGALTYKVDARSLDLKSSGPRGLGANAAEAPKP